MTHFRGLVLAAAVLAGCNPPPPVPGPAGTDLKSAVAPNPELSNTGNGDRVVLTDRAAKQIRSFMQRDPGVKYLRVSVSGDQFKLDMDPQTDAAEDLASTSRGVPIVVDRTSAAGLPFGIIVDYIDDEAAKGFRFASPGSDQDQPDTNVSLADARWGFKTTLRPQKVREVAALPEPPADVFRVVRYDAPSGKLAAYMTPDPKDGRKRPAIVWITGGDCNTIDAGCWREGGAFGDQSASVYRKAGIVMMFPGLRGGDGNPGMKEWLLGEVDDVLAAVAYLRAQPHVDPERVYLGGHSTGGTLALLTAECSNTFRAVFSFGPAGDVLGQRVGAFPFSFGDPREFRLRSAAQWLHSIRGPVFVFEGENEGNAHALRSMAGKTKNPNAQFFVIKGANHFNVLGPTNRLIVDRILKDTGPACNLAFTADELNAPFLK